MKFSNFSEQLSDVILDLFPHREGPCLARINFFKSRLIFESFSDSSKDVDLVSQVMTQKSLIKVLNLKVLDLVGYIHFI
jgi:hypothetical protein